MPAGGGFDQSRHDECDVDDFVHDRTKMTKVQDVIRRV